MTESYENQYIKILEKIRNEGFVEKNERTGIEVSRIPHAIIEVDLGIEFPILKCKQVFWKSALKEILWIMQKQSNNIKDLNAHIWDSWANEDGSIGKSYGYQVGKSVAANDTVYGSQVDYVLERLHNDPSDRRALIDLWNVDDLHEMNLVPCCFASHWTVINGELNCMLMQRSSDYLVGVPFNTTQYAMLTILFARHLGVRPGKLTHVMSDAHMYRYDSHIIGAKKMVDNVFKLNHMTSLSSEEEKEVWKSHPRFVIDSPEKDFFSINVEDCKVEDYKYMEKINFDVAV